MGNKIKILLILILVMAFSITGTYCVFTWTVSASDACNVPGLTTKFIANDAFLAKVQGLDPTIVSVDKTTDLHQATNPPTIELTNANKVSTSNSDVPTYLWIDNGTIYYYTVAITIDINNE